jgi:hypothetical protein
VTFNHNCYFYIFKITLFSIQEPQVSTLLRSHDNIWLAIQNYKLLDGTRPWIVWLVTNVSTEVHKIPTRVQCTVQVCELAVSNLHPPPYRSWQIICLSHLESVGLPLQLPMRPSPHQLHAGPGRSIPCTAQQHTSSHTVRCARLVHLCVSTILFTLQRHCPTWGIW